MCCFFSSFFPLVRSTTVAVRLLLCTNLCKSDFCVISVQKIVTFLCLMHDPNTSYKIKICDRISDLWHVSDQGWVIWGDGGKTTDRGTQCNYTLPLSLRSRNSAASINICTSPIAAIFNNNTDIITIRWGIPWMYTACLALSKHSGCFAVLPLMI